MSFVIEDVPFLIFSNIPHGNRLVFPQLANSFVIFRNNGSEISGGHIQDLLSHSQGEMMQCVGMFCITARWCYILIRTWDLVTPRLQALGERSQNNDEWRQRGQAVQEVTLLCRWSHCIWAVPWSRMDLLGPHPAIQGCVNLKRGIF